MVFVCDEAIKFWLHSAHFFLAEQEDFKYGLNIS